MDCAVKAVVIFNFGNYSVRRKFVTFWFNHHVYVMLIEVSGQCYLFHSHVDNEPLANRYSGSRGTPHPAAAG